MPKWAQDSCRKQYQHDACKSLSLQGLSLRCTPAFRSKDAAGSVWLWTCIDPETGLVPLWLIGPRDERTAHEVRLRIEAQFGDVQITNESPCLDAFMLERGTQAYSEDSIASERREVLALRMSAPWFHALPEGAALKVERHAAGLALYLMYHNFVRLNRRLGATPAMAAAIADRAWSAKDVASLIT
jgi:hypothetical protein